MSHQSSTTRLAGAAFAALCLLSSFPAQAQDAGQEGMVVARDPQTGRMRPPTPEEIQALRARKAATAPGPGTSTAGQTTGRAVMLGPDGSRGVRLGEKRLVYEVVRRGPDGKLSSQCVEGAEAAHQAVTQPASTQPAPHTHQAEASHEAR